VQDSVLNALQSAVEAIPSDAPLRLHYAQALASAGRHSDALDQAAVVLATQPDNRVALSLAEASARESGEQIRALGYRNLLEALSWNAARNLIESDSSADPKVERERESPLRMSEAPDNTAAPEHWESELPDITLADVAGMEDVKKRLHLSFLGPLRNPELRKLYGKSLKGGLLLFGPPGCGKTYIARAVAGELGARFVSIGITEVMEMWIGQSERNLHSFFEFARRNKPCVLFIDELDALGRKRSLMRHSAGSTIINALLSEMDGVQYDNEGVYVLAATNHPWDIEPALRRPGRLDRMLLVLPPDEKARASIVSHLIRERPCDSIDIAWLASKTDEFSGADVAHLCDSAAEFALEDSIGSGLPRKINMGDFRRALKDVKASTRAWFDTAKNHALFANDGGIYDELLEYLKKRRML
jgi:SpoVK/Ycf46/Vps4 family AAA+-type ATPase